MLIFLLGALSMHGEAYGVYYHALSTNNNNDNNW